MLLARLVDDEGLIHVKSRFGLVSLKSIIVEAIARGISTSIPFRKLLQHNLE